MTSRVHIIGAGLAGLAAAVRLAHLGPSLTIYEAAPRAGGRCRSYHDTHLGCVIDNGNHLLLSGNTSAAEYLAEIGASDLLAGPPGAAFPFVDAAAKKRWTVELGKGPIPWWIFSAKRRVPDTDVSDYLSAMRLLRAPQDATVAECVGTDSALYRNFWEPLTIAALNTSPEQGAAVLMRPVLRETFMRGADACRPLVARDSLAATLVTPAVDKLRASGADIRFGTRIHGLTMEGSRVAALDASGEMVGIATNDIVILAVPPWVAETLVPDLQVPPPGEPIVNVHYRLPAPVTAPGEVKIAGVIGGFAQWVFARGDLASVTISAASSVADDPAEDIATRCWADVALALELGDMPEAPSRVVKERRATFAQTPETIRLRHGTASAWLNLLLAGDWTATGLPATIESAIRSGFRAAAMAASRRTNLSVRAEQTQSTDQIHAA